MPSSRQRRPPSSSLKGPLFKTFVENVTSPRHHVMLKCACRARQRRRLLNACSTKTFFWVMNVFRSKPYCSVLECIVKNLDPRRVCQKKRFVLTRTSQAGRLMHGIVLLVISHVTVILVGSVTSWLAEATHSRKCPKTIWKANVFTSGCATCPVIVVRPSSP